MNLRIFSFCDSGHPNSDFSYRTTVVRDWSISIGGSWVGANGGGGGGRGPLDFEPSQRGGSLYFELTKGGGSSYL